MTTLAALLETHAAELRAFLGRHAGWLRRYETVDDLAQGLAVRALERGRSFRFEGRERFLAWIHTVARSFLADRRAYWGALKRRTSGLVRLTASGGSAGAPVPAGTGTGPITFATRREQLVLAVRALALLLPRDRKLVRWHAEQVPLPEQAVALSISHAAARQASVRALERFRKAFELVRKRG